MMLPLGSRKREVTVTSLTTSILAKVLASAVSQGIEITSSFLKSKLQGWIFDDATIDRLAEKLKKLDLDELNERGIAKKLENDQEVNDSISNITQGQSINSVNQTHSGHGDNIAGSKIINYGKCD